MLNVFYFEEEADDVVEACAGDEGGDVVDEVSAAAAAAGAVVVVVVEVEVAAASELFSLLLEVPLPLFVLLLLLLLLLPLLFSWFDCAECARRADCNVAEN